MKPATEATSLRRRGGRRGEGTLDLRRLQELPVLMGRLLEWVAEGWQPRAAALVLHTEEGEPYLVRQVRNLPERCREVSFPVEGEVARRLASSPQTVDLKREEAWLAGLAGEEREALESLETRLLVPIRLEEGLLGWLHLGEKRSGRPYLPGECRRLEGLAEEAGIALANALLYDRRRRELAALEAVNRIALAATTLELDDLLEQIYQEVARLVEAPNFYIALYDEEAREFSFAFYVEEGERRRSEEGERWPLGAGLTSDIVRTAEPIVTQDYVAECERRGIRPRERNRGQPGLAWLGVPLRAGRRILGVLCISSPREGTVYRSEHVRLLSTIASQAAVVLERAALGERERRRVAELEMLDEIARTVRSSLRLDELLPAIYRAVQRVLEAPNFYIALYDEVRAEFTFALYVERGEEAEPPSGRWPLGEGLSSEIVRRRQPIVTDDYLTECARRGVPPGGRPGKAWLGVPMTFRDQVIGVMVASTFESKTTYGEEEVRLLSTIAAQVAGAVQNARLYQESCRRLEELTTLLQVGTQIVSTFDLSEVLNTVCREAVRLLRATSAYVCDWNAEKKESTVIAEYMGPEASPREQVSDLGTTYREDFLAWILERGRPYTVRLSDPNLPSSEREHLEQYGGNTVLLLPLLARGRAIGFIEVWESRYSRTFTEDEILLGQNLAGLAAVAVENARLYARTDLALSRRVGELEAIEEIARELNTSLDFQRILQVLLERAMAATGATAGLVAMRTPDGEGLFIVIQHGYPEEADRYRTRPWDIRHGIIGRVVRTGRPALVPDVRRDPDYAPVNLASRSEVAVPIFAGGRAIGVINLESERPAAFDEEHLRFLERLAEHAAIAIQNARLFQERERRITELAILNEVGRAVSSALELNELLEVIYRQVSRLFDTTNFYIALYEEETDEWEVLLNIEHGERWPPERYRVGSGLTGYIIRRRVSLLFRTTAEIQAFIEREGIAPLGPFSRSWLGVPLIAADRVVGAMTIQNYDQENCYSEQDLALFSTVAAQAAIAIANARLFHRMREARDRLQAVLDSTGDGILLLDGQGQILLANPPIERWSGLPREEMFGRSLFWLIQAVSAGRPETRRILLKELARGRRALRREARAVLRGSVELAEWAGRSFEWLSLPVQEQERPTARLLVLRETTEARAAERMREDLIGMIIHDLRGPLTAILGALETLLVKDMGPLNEVQRSLLEVAREGGQHLLDLVDTLLDIRRLEAGRMPLHLRAVHLPEVVRRAVLHLEPLLQERRLRIALEFPPDLPAVRADEERLGQVVENLLHNAIKYSYPGGLIQVRAWEERPAVVCAVTDHGVGIPKAEQERIFEKFVQVHRAGAPPGTGLGLAFCRLAVEAHGGMIRVESEEGRGSTFSFTLPIWEG
ncbi:MAG: GAF domain-containing protein [Chloroflexia bacterium]